SWTPTCLDWGCPKPVVPAPPPSWLGHSDWGQKGATPSLLREKTDRWEVNTQQRGFVLRVLESGTGVENGGHASQDR
ncbi:hypothetical protein PI126_g23608, partial [Phytophthora idaei]